VEVRKHATQPPVTPRTGEEERLEFAREELGASVAEAPIGVRVGDDGDNDVILFDTAGLQFLNELCITG
jgi:hypothetical protein